MAPRSVEAETVQPVVCRSFATDTTKHGRWEQLCEHRSKISELAANPVERSGKEVLFAGATSCTSCIAEGLRMRGEGYTRQQPPEGGWLFEERMGYANAAIASFSFSFTSNTVSSLVMTSRSFTFFERFMSFSSPPAFLTEV